ncbi:phospho-sugar mutase [Brochothrix campestris]|uniref:Phosphoglucomutase n=1 Tax=Brochothrix campestris FSL F6-1037 TaxID=1265861 RepID=W7CY77_9LIST|nr:phospho-sugar mutase [Brochothrix campestris]EUJ41892.1 phosphoglucomutase [Brochothrix campestris FSL F6-1037]
MSWKKAFHNWDEFEQLNELNRQELDEIKLDKTELEDHFYKYIEFGTAGMRGVLGVGTNRLNEYTIRWVSEGLAQYILSQGKLAVKRGVVIAYDSRHFSQEFAYIAASVLALHEIKAYVFESLRPTPELSYAIRYLKAYNGIMITASHNPAQYNGFKVYGEDGAQMTPSAVAAIVANLEQLKGRELTLAAVDTEMAIEQGKIKVISELVDKPYLCDLESVVINDSLIRKHGNDVGIVYTPLHGTGGVLMPQVLEVAGFTNVEYVTKQMNPDPEFSTVNSPNPENIEAFNYAIRVGDEIAADVLLATDPDADRLGVAVPDSNGRYQILSGNQIGALILNYVLDQRKQSGLLPHNAAVVKSIVTSDIGRKIAAHYDVAMFEVLTGFKYIGEKIAQWQADKKFVYQFGYEESNGYMLKAFTRDKDALQAGLMFAELTLAYKQAGLTVLEGLEKLYDQFGYYSDEVVSLTLDGMQGVAEINRIMTNFKTTPPQTVADLNVVVIEDFAKQTRTDCLASTITTLDLPQADVLKFYLEDGSWFCVRPSGTEPKIKFYYCVSADTAMKAADKLMRIKTAVTMLVQ